MTRVHKCDSMKAAFNAVLCEKHPQPTLPGTGSKRPAVLLYVTKSAISPVACCVRCASMACDEVDSASQVRNTASLSAAGGGCVVQPEVQMLQAADGCCNSSPGTCM